MLVLGAFLSPLRRESSLQFFDAWVFGMSPAGAAFNHSLFQQEVGAPQQVPGFGTVLCRSGRFGAGVRMNQWSAFQSGRHFD